MGGTATRSAPAACWPQGDLRLIALALVAEQPRHGYEIIKVLEDKTEGWYSPSPGIVYPTLTYLEEVGYVTAKAEGAKKLYSITEEGRAHLTENRDFVDAVLERLAAVGRKIARMRRRDRNEERESRDERMPQLVRAAFDNLANEAPHAARRRCRTRSQNRRHPGARRCRRPPQLSPLR